MTTPEEEEFTIREADLSDPKEREMIEKFLEGEPVFLTGSPEDVRADLEEAEKE